MIRTVIKLALAGGILGTAIFATAPRADQPSDPAAAPATITMRERPLPGVTPSIRVEGEIVGVDGGGMLAVSINGVVLAQQAATAGAFSVEITGTRTSGMVLVEYVEPGIRFNTNLGSYAQVARLAGADARLTLDDCTCTRISPFSTALQLVVSRAVGRAPTNDTQFDDAIRTVGFDLATATVVLARLADDPTRLPAGHASGLALLEDEAAFAQFLTDTHQEILWGSYADALDAIPAAAISAADVPARFALLSPLLDMQTPTTTGAWVGERIDADTYKMHGYPTHGDLVHRVAFNTDGALVLEPDRDLVFDRAPTLCPLDNTYVSRYQQVLGHELRRHWTGSRNEIWQVTTVIENSTPDCSDFFPNQTYRETSFQALADLSTPRHLTTARNFQTVALPTFCDSSGSYTDLGMVRCEYAIHDFGANGLGETRELGMKVDSAMQPVLADGRAPFTWAMGADAAMHVQAGAERARYWVLDGGDGVALGVVYVADADRDIGNVSISGYTPMIRVRRPDVFATVSPLGAWGYGTMDVSNRPYLHTGPAAPVRIVRDADGISTHWWGGHATRRETWTMADGRLHETIWRGQGCVPAIAGCVPTHVRYFRPLARMGNRIHGIEDMYYNVGPTSLPPYNVTRDSRPQFHERREMPVAESRFPFRAAGKRAEIMAPAGY